MHAAAESFHAEVFQILHKIWGQVNFGVAVSGRIADAEEGEKEPAVYALYQQYRVLLFYDGELVFLGGEVQVFPDQDIFALPLPEAVPACSKYNPS